MTNRTHAAAAAAAALAAAAAATAAAAALGFAALAMQTHPTAPTYTDAHTLVLEMCANTPDDHPTLDLCYDYAYALELNP
jgi:alkylation response protein AidB-like acyl-CoA dehydrogenase